MQHLHFGVLLRVLFRACASALLLAPGFAQQTLLVPSQYPTIKSAVQAAADGDTVLVSPGIYQENVISLGGKEITVRSVSGPRSTTIDGLYKDRLLRFTGGETLNTVLEGFALVQGRAPTTGGTIGDGGGAILFQNCSAVIRNCEFRGNLADWGTDAPQGALGYRGGHGGAVYLINADVRFEGCRFSRNQAGNGGRGGKGNTGPSGSAFSWNGGVGGNGQRGGTGGHGGAVFVDGQSAPTFVSCLFEDNRTGFGGPGGAGGTGGQSHRDFLFGLLGTGGTGGKGGSGGSSGSGAAVFADNGARVVMGNCTFVGGDLRSGGAGGAKGSGGAGATNGAAGTAGGSGGRGGGGAVSATTNQADVYNSIVWGNDVPEIRGASLDFTVISGGAAGTGNRNEDPAFVSSTDFRLSPGSPCIDAGDSTRLPAWATEDLSGLPRTLDNPLVPDSGFGIGPMVDLGAYEFADAYALSYGCGTNPAGSLTIVSGEPAIGTTLTFGIDNPLGTQSAGALPVLLYSLTPPVGSCGVPLPGFGMAGGGAGGALLVGPNFDGILGAPWAGSGTPAPVSAPLPNLASLIGVSIYTQGALIGGGGKGLTDAIELLVGP